LRFKNFQNLCVSKILLG